MNRRHRRRAHIDVARVPLAGEREPAVLRLARLADIHLREDFDARQKDGINPFREFMPSLEQSVDADADAHAGSLRFHMDVACAFVRRLREHSIDERFDGRDFARHARRDTAMHLRFLLVDGAERLLHELMKLHILLHFRHAHALLSFKLTDLNLALGSLYRNFTQLASAI